MRSLVASILLALGLATPAFAQYPQDAATAGASDTTVQKGQEVTIGGEGWEPGSVVDLRWPSSQQVEAAVDQQGEFSTTVVVPEGSGAGEQVVRVGGMSGAGEPTEIGIRMLVGGQASGQIEVPYSGLSITMWVLIAVGLFLVGVVSVLQVRRRTLTR
jgi:hypothetical protein